MFARIDARRFGIAPGLVTESHIHFPGRARKRRTLDVMRQAIGWPLLPAELMGDDFLASADAAIGMMPLVRDETLAENLALFALPFRIDDHGVPAFDAIEPEQVLAFFGLDLTLAQACALSKHEIAGALRAQTDRLFPLAYSRELDATFRQILREGWGIEVPALTPAWRDAVRFWLVVEDNRKLLERLLRHAAIPSLITIEQVRAVIDALVERAPPDQAATVFVYLEDTISVAHYRSVLANQAPERREAILVALRKLDLSSKRSKTFFAWLTS